MTRSIGRTMPIVVMTAMKIVRAMPMPPTT